MIKLTPEKPPYYEIVDGSKVLKVKLTQTSTEAPTLVATFINTLQTEDLILTREDVGHYNIELEEDLPANKWEIILSPLSNDINIMGYQQVDTNIIQLRQAKAADGTGQDTFTIVFTLVIYP